MLCERIFQLYNSRTNQSTPMQNTAHGFILETMIQPLLIRRVDISGMWAFLLSLTLYSIGSCLFLQLPEETEL